MQCGAVRDRDGDGTVPLPKLHLVRGGLAPDSKPRHMQWWMYVLVAAGLVVVFDVLLILWLGIATREIGEEPRHISDERNH